MAHLLKQFPTGTQTFKQIISRNNLYVDKTAPLAEMLKSYTKALFLSRPRRFGKSLTVSTLKSLFSETERQLFTGLAAEKHLNEAEFYPRPVIHLDMSKPITSDGLEVFISSLKSVTAVTAQKFGVDVKSLPTAGDMLGSLIQTVSQKSNKEIAVLIDEYDARSLNAHTALNLKQSVP
jgi:hypothetical protein